MSLSTKIINMKYLFIIVLTILSIGTSQANGVARKVILDTDMGTDDWLALAYLEENPGIDLVGVTIVGNGLTPCPYAASNAKYILGLSKENDATPVGCGSSWPMDGYASYPLLWREGGISMLGEIIPTTNPMERYDDATTLMSKLLIEASEPVEIIAIGAMTNIASVIKAQPKLKKKIKLITSMGGAVDVPGNLRVHGFTDQHPNTKAEWNFYIDPVAAKIVIRSGIPIRLVPLDATNKVPLTAEFVEQIHSLPASPIQSFVARTFDRVRTSSSNGEYYHWDPLAAVVADNPSVCDRDENRRLDVVSLPGQDYGIPNGQSPSYFPLSGYFGKKRKPLSELAAGATVKNSKTPSVKVCFHVDPAVYEMEFIKGIRGLF